VGGRGGAWWELVQLVKSNRLQKNPSCNNQEKKTDIERKEGKSRGLKDSWNARGKLMGNAKKGNKCGVRGKKGEKVTLVSDEGVEKGKSGS